LSSSLLRLVSQFRDALLGVIRAVGLSGTSWMPFFFSTGIFFLCRLTGGEISTNSNRYQ
jgi:hypothetical protein